MLPRKSIVRCAGVLLAFASLFAGIRFSRAQSSELQKPQAELFARDNLVAWCIVPFDAKKRGPEERAAMLKRLGLKHYAYDWRAEHLPTLEAELAALKRHGVALDAVWFPSGLDKDGRFILDTLARHGVKTQLWVTGGGEPTKSPDEQRERVKAEAARIRPIAEEAAKIGCTVGLYNHGGWFGEPENQLAILDELKAPNVGLVYNLHHGHDHLDRFAALLEKIKPHLLALNLNGMVAGGERRGQKILPLGQGDLDLELLKTIRASGYRGPIGILGHTTDDAEARLADNLDGLDWLVAQLDGKPARPKPKPRTPMPAAAPAAKAVGWLAAGRDEYRRPPLTIECWAKLNSKQNYNILVASDTKQSGAHWEPFSMAGDGRFTVYVPGMQPDHVRSDVDICDGEWHHLEMQFEPDRLRLYCDGRQVADQAIKSLGKAAAPGGLAFGRLVEGGLDCDGVLDWVRLRRGASSLANPNRDLPKVDDATLGLWRFGQADKPAEDLSPHRNAAQVAAATPAASAEPPPGNHLLPHDKRLKAVLVDRSPNDAYLAVKVDTMGRIFVGGREAVFVFEPNAAGGYEPKRELLKFPKDSIIIGLEMRGHDLYVQTSSALYLVPDGVVKREGLELKRLVWGVPLDLHVSFHCLAWGPEGNLYLNHGDPLLNYGDWRRPDHWGYWTLHTQPEGTTTPYTGVGAVLRVRPDGSRLDVVARGFRGPVGLAFDRHWNLFTNDNDHESRADAYAPARLMHVTPGADFAWPRGWMASKSPERADLLEPMIATLGRGAPCDLTYYEDPYLTDVIEPALLMCRWDRGSVGLYSPRPRGASFSAEELPFLEGEQQIRPVGVTVGRGGRVFVTSLYLGGNVVSPYCASDLVMITRADDPPEHPFEACDMTTRAAARLWSDLSSRSWELRSRAHQEILRRGWPLLDEAARRFVAMTMDGDDPALQHLSWLAGASGSRAARHRLLQMTKHSRAELRQLGLRVLAEYRGFEKAAEWFSHLQLLSDEDPHVQLVALNRFFNSPVTPPQSIVAKLAGGSDTYLRQTAARLLAARIEPADLAALSQSEDEATRLGAMLAAGIRLTVPPLHDPPPEKLPLFYPKDNAFFHTKLQFADVAEPVELSQLGRIGSYTIAERWKTIPPDEEQRQLAELLQDALDDESSAVVSQAVYYLSLLGDERIEPRLAAVRQSLAKKKLAGAALREVAQAWRIGPFDDAASLEKPHPPEQGAIDLAASYPGESAPLVWQEIRAEGGRFSAASLPPSSGGSYYLYFQLQSVSRQPALMMLDSEDASNAWHNGRPIEPLAASDSGAREWLLDLQPGSNDILLRMHADEAFGDFALTVQARGEVAVVLPERLGVSELAARLKSGGGAECIAEEFLEIDWPEAASQGDAARGRKLFGTLGCGKCHAISPTQRGGGAPSLVEAKKRFTIPYLVESVLLPSKQVAEPFKATVIVTGDGQIVTGLVVNESQEELELLLADATRSVIVKSQIEERSIATVSPMPAGIVKTAAELRDLLAYLLSHNPMPP